MCRNVLLYIEKCGWRLRLQTLTEVLWCCCLTSLPWCFIIKPIVNDISRAQRSMFTVSVCGDLHTWVWETISLTRMLRLKKQILNISVFKTNMTVAFYLQMSDKSQGESLMGPLKNEWTLLLIMNAHKPSAEQRVSIMCSQLQTSQCDERHLFPVGLLLSPRAGVFTEKIMHKSKTGINASVGVSFPNEQRHIPTIVTWITV